MQKLLSNPHTATQAHDGDIAYIFVQNITESEEGVQGDAALVEPNDRSKRGATSYRNLLWSGGVIPYTISSLYTSECFVMIGVFRKLYLLGGEDRNFDKVFPSWDPTFGSIISMTILA